MDIPTKLWNSWRGRTQDVGDSTYRSKWLVEMAEYFEENPQVNGFIRSGITGALDGVDGNNSESEPEESEESEEEESEESEEQNEESKESDEDIV